MLTAIFDLDGTIADTIYDLADATNHGLVQLGYPTHTYEAYKLMVGNGIQKLCERALPDEHKDELEKLHDLFDEYYSAHYLDKTKLYPNMKETLEVLAENGVKLAVATNKPQNFAREIIKALLPDIEFVKVLGGCNERPKKPDTAIINDILEALPDTDNTVFMIGDSNVDVQTAKNAGITSIGCQWGFRGRDELVNAGADHIAVSAEDISRIILG